MKISEEQLKDCMIKGLSTKEIAIKYSLGERAIRSRQSKLASKGFSPEHDMVHQVPDGFLMKGQSTLYGKDGQIKLTWVKSAIDRDKQIEIIKEFIEGMKDDIPREPVSTQAPAGTLSKLLSMYVITDLHLGMLAWGEESGEDYDMKIAEDLLVKWFEMAIANAPASSVGLLAQLGDFLHWDGLDAVTPMSGHVLDADTRFQKLARMSIKVTRRVISMMLQKHEKVHVIFAEGNHDMASSIWMREWLKVLYEDEPRVTVDCNPDPYYCYVHGETTLFFHHGHKKRMDGIAETFAAKFRKEWGNSKYTYAHTGHLHHTKMLENSMMIVEQHRTLAAKDAYASRGGWLSGRSASVITYNKQYGEVGRVTISPDMLK